MEKETPLYLQVLYGISPALAVLGFAGAVYLINGLKVSETKIVEKRDATSEDQRIRPSVLETTFEPTSRPYETFKREY